MPKIVQSAGLIRKSKSITTNLDDTVANGNALLGSGFEFANAILVGLDGASTGAVKIRTAEGQDLTIPYLTPGIWHNMEPFSHVYNSGTTADTILVGVTF